MLEILREHSASGINKFQECTQLYHYEYVDGFETVNKSTAMIGGTALHVGQEAYWTGKSLEESIQAIEEEVKTNGWHEDPTFLPKIRAYIRGYYNKWRALDDAEEGRYHVIGVEEAFSYPSGVNGALLAGRIDGVLYDSKDNVTLILEHKGTSSKLAQEPSSAYWDKLQMDTQLYLYADYLTKEYNRPVQGLWDVTITSPKSHPSGKKKIAKRKVETPEDFALRKSENMENIAEFEARLTATFMEDSTRYIRRRIPILDHRLERKMAEIRLVVQSMQNDFTPIRNTNACSSYGGCPYMDVCLGYAELKDSPRFQKRKKYNKKIKFKNPLPF